MVKILHMADTHVSHRRTHDVRDAWKEHNRVTWIEEDYCLGLKNALEVAAKGNYNYVVHAGDFFDVPVGRNLSTPTEYSRAYAIRELLNFMEKTKYKVPLIIIDGNHGLYQTRNSSTIEFLHAAFPDTVHIVTSYQLKRAIVNNEPLKVEFDDVVFYLFPYVRYDLSDKLKRAYDEWLRNNQKPDENKISIAVVHGMEHDKDLHPLILQFDYDYIALGHNHNFGKKTSKAWFAGSTERYTFAERNQRKVVLDVEVRKNENPIVLPIDLPTKRPMIQIDFHLNNEVDVLPLEEKIKKEVERFKTPFNGETAARIKIQFDGMLFLSTWWRLEEKLREMQKEVFSEKYNILEFRWDESALIKQPPISKNVGVLIHDYLIEDPIKDFEKYVRNLGLPDTHHAKSIINLGAEILKEVFGETAEQNEQESEN